MGDESKPDECLRFQLRYTVISHSRLRRYLCRRQVFAANRHCAMFLSVRDGHLSRHALVDLPGDGICRFPAGRLARSVAPISCWVVLWWRMMIEASMMLAAILPGFVMARIEGRQFGDFGLPARRAFGRNFWVGTLWGIASLSVLMLALRATGAFEFGSLALHGRAHLEICRLLRRAFSAHRIL